MTVHVATGLSHGQQASPDHAARAVRRALSRAGLNRASSVVLFLTADYAHHLDSALRAAAGAAGTLQVIGATGSGILTEDEWVLDSHGACALVLGDPLHLEPVVEPALPGTVVLSLATPAGLSADWLEPGATRLGAVSADLFGHGPFSVWNNARAADSGCVEALIGGARGAIGVAQGVRALTAPLAVTDASGFELKRLGDAAAFSVLLRSLPEAIRERGEIPLHLIMAGIALGDPDTALRDGRYRLCHIVAANHASQSLTLTDRLPPDARLFLAMRDPDSAERDMGRALDEAHATLGADPDFALLFPCMGRGPNFFGNRDRDLELLRARYPRLPIIGMYGNGEIGPLAGKNHLYQYSATLGLFCAGAIH